MTLEIDRSQVSLVGRFFWRPLHIVFNWLALKFDPKGLVLPEPRGLWRINDWLADRYLPPISEEMQKQLAEMLGSMIQCVPVYGDDGLFLGFKDAEGVLHGTEDEDTTEENTLPGLNPIEDVTDHAHEDKAS